MNQGYISDLADNILLGIIVNYHQTNSYKAYDQIQKMSHIFHQIFVNHFSLLTLTFSKMVTLLFLAYKHMVFYIAMLLFFNFHLLSLKVIINLIRSYRA